MGGGHNITGRIPFMKPTERKESSVYKREWGKMYVSAFLEVAGVPAFEWVPTCFTRLELVFPQGNNRDFYSCNSLALFCFTLLPNVPQPSLP